MTTPAFRKTVWDFYKKQGRHDLPWRKTTDPYKILVSEVMLQQTQVERVRGYYAAWLKKFPNVKALARASLADVLKAWQGLGYNRRAKMLHDAAKEVVREYEGKMPTGPGLLVKLPGIGPYTARAVAAFSTNADVVFIETNLRTVVLHHFFPKRKMVSDAELLAVLMEALPKGRAREWYAALMDYGSYLKRSGVKRNAQSKGYAKQSAFAGSGRQARGAILKELAKEAATAKRLTGLLGDDRAAQMQEQLAKLLAEGMVQRAGSRYALPD
ncbi:MAG TPA: A/G-specific adenine glycosylase [Candidatus Paceibacterota bacterium]|jgi:A/G-specific adenine glycosylase|nr:A/G-specific adenine glycosylase [Candidatus Paceibacterota bacterium]